MSFLTKIGKNPLTVPMHASYLEALDTERRPENTVRVVKIINLINLHGEIA